MSAQIIQFTATDELPSIKCSFCTKSYNPKFTKVIKVDSGKSACEHCIRRMKKLMNIETPT